MLDNRSYLVGLFLLLLAILCDHCDGSSVNVTDESDEQSNGCWSHEAGDRRRRGGDEEGEMLSDDGRGAFLMDTFKAFCLLILP